MVNILKIIQFVLIGGWLLHNIVMVINKTNTF